MWWGAESECNKHAIGGTDSISNRAACAKCVTETLAESGGESDCDSNAHPSTVAVITHLHPKSGHRKSGPVFVYDWRALYGRER